MIAGAGSTRESILIIPPLIKTITVGFPAANTFNAKGSFIFNCYS